MKRIFKHYDQDSDSSDVQQQKQEGQAQESDKNVIAMRMLGTMPLVHAIAMVCHEANRAYCNALGDTSQLPWNEAEQWQRDSAIKGVEFRLENPYAPPSASHESWLKEKEETGWKYGPVKDVEKKEHPCFVPYDELPEADKLKDALFIGVVDALTGRTSAHGQCGSTMGRTVESEEAFNARMAELKEQHIRFIHEVRLFVDGYIQATKLMEGSREVSLCHTNLQRTKHWLGKCLGEIGTANPYPQSTDANSPVIEEQADRNTGDGMQARWTDYTQTAKAKDLRGLIAEEIVDKLKGFMPHSEAFAWTPYSAVYFLQAILAAEEAKMWLGWELDRIREQDAEKK